VDDSEDHRLLFDLISQMLNYDTGDRVNLIAAMRHPFFNKLTSEQRRLPSSRDKSYSLSR
jgi:serine/threonine protein kinase